VLFADRVRQRALGSGIGAWTYYPYSTGTYNQAGDVWINSQYSYNFSPNPGNYAYLTLLHEVGHAMGLKHPTEGTAVLPTAEDSRLYTDMSYRADALMPGVEPQTYMLYDIAALQSLYGVNTTTGAGDNVYSFAGANNLLETIWDASDRYVRATGLASAVKLDLQGGHWFPLVSAQRASRNNVTIATTSRSRRIWRQRQRHHLRQLCSQQAGGRRRQRRAQSGGADYFVLRAAVDKTR
jgi:serralysin